MGIKIFFFGLIFLFISTSIIFSQEPRTRQFSGEPIGVVRGKVVDDQSNSPMEYVSVRIFRFRDSTIVSGTLTDKNGNFEIKNLPFGRYYLVLKFIGFKTKVVDSIFVLPRNPEVNIGTIHFQSEPLQTKEVEVSAQKDIVSYSIDRRIYDVSRDLSVVGGTAIDVLSNVPSVSVDIEGNVSLRGSGNVQILIDGKPSALLGFDRGAALDQIPADNIERIEVITNPSAKYDPDGVAGIINIVLKKNTMFGYGAILNANIGTADKYNGSINLNFRNETFNTTLGYNFRAFNMRGRTEASRNSFAPDTTALIQNQDFLRRGQFHRIQFSTEWLLNPQNSLIFSAGGGFFNRKMSDSTGYLMNFIFNDQLEKYYRKTSADGSNFSYDLSLNYKRIFEKKDKELNANVLFNSFKGNDENLYFTKPIIDTSRFERFGSENNKNKYLNNNITFELNYVNPLNFGKIEIGAKANLRTIDLEYKYFVLDPKTNQWIPTISDNIFNYNENIVAGYAIFSTRLKKFGYQIGLRLEGTATKAEQTELSNVYKNSYLNLFPTIHLNYQITNSNTLFFSYTRRINRPQSMILNPYEDRTDPQNISKGNPYLKPEFTNSFEISNLTYFGRSSINLTLFYRYTTDIISRITTLDTSGYYSITTYKNLNKSKNIGFEAMLNQNLFDWWKLNINFSYFYLDVNGIPEYGIPARNSKSWNIKINSVLSLTKNIDVQLNISYDAPVVTTGGGGMYWRFFQMGSVGQMEGVFTANLSFKIDILNDRGTINFRLMDIFKTIKYDLTTNGSNFISKLYRTRESRVAFLGFQYKINEYKRPKIKRPEDMPEMEFD